MLKPLNDYVLLEVEKEDPKTASGIITAPSSKETSWKGRVLRVWEWKRTDDGNLIKIDNIKEGDIVYFTKYSPEEIEQSWKKYLLVKVDNIIAKQE